MEVAAMPSFRTVAGRSAAALLTLAFAVAPLSAQTADGVEQARVNYEGRILGNQVTIRSGPGENYYPVVRLDSGTNVIINGIKFDWLRIVPPAGTHSLIAKEFVTVTGTTGRVTGSMVNVRAGSTLNSQYATIHGKLQRGDLVEILGEVELDGKTWLKIKPPPGTALFVRKDFVEPVRALGPSTPPVAAVPTGPGVGVTPPTATTGPSVPRVTPGTVAGNTPSAAPAATRRTGTIYGDGVAGNIGDLARDTGTGVPGTENVGPTRNAAREVAEREYDAAESAWQETIEKPIDEQPLPELLARFQALAANEDLPITLRQQAASTARFIQARNETREDLLKLKQSQAEMEARLRPLQEQNRQLQAQFQQFEQTRYSAIGQLQTSTLGGMHRLVDPANGRTLVYLRLGGTVGAPAVGQFVGVRGAIGRDEVLNVQVISPDAVVPVDPALFGRGLTAEIFPPSLRDQLPAPSTPTTPSTPGQ
jgi:hypothetical protein